MEQNKWKIEKITRLKHKLYTSFIVEAMCPYCKHYSTQEIFGDDTDAKMYYRFCPRCGKELITNDKSKTVKRTS